MKKVIFSILFTIGIIGLAYGQQASQSKDADWEKIGQTTINLSEDNGIFDWDKDRMETINANDKYSAIRFRSKDAKVNLSDVEVEYDNGKKEKLNLSSAIDSKTNSKQLKLDTRADLDKIHFSFIKDESAAVDKATIEVWGLKAGASGMGQRGTDVDVDVNRNRNRDKDTDIEIERRDRNRDMDVDLNRERNRDRNRDIDVDVDIDTTRSRR